MFGWGETKTPIAAGSAEHWAVTTTAIITVANQGTFDTLEGHPKKQCRALLASWWECESRAKFDELLLWLEREGHRTDWQAARNGDYETDDEYAIVTRNVTVESIAAWDLCRAVAMIRWAIGAGYLKPDEGRPSILRIAAQLQRAFSSWSDVGANYMVGRQFWQAMMGFKHDPNDLVARTYQSLCAPTNAKSPWRQVPFERAPIA